MGSKADEIKEEVGSPKDPMPFFCQRNFRSYFPQGPNSNDGKEGEGRRGRRIEKENRNCEREKDLELEKNFSRSAFRIFLTSQRFRAVLPLTLQRDRFCA